MLEAIFVQFNNFSAVISFTVITNRQSPMWQLRVLIYVSLQQMVTFDKQTISHISSSNKPMKARLKLDGII